MKNITGQGHLMIPSKNRPGYQVCSTCGVYDDNPEIEKQCKSPAAATDAQRRAATVHSGRK